MNERKNKFMELLETIVIMEDAIEGEWYSNVSAYINDLSRILKVIREIKKKQY